MSKKSSRPRGPNDPPDRGNSSSVTVVEGPTLRLNDGGSDRATVLHASHERRVDDDAPTAMIDLNAIAGAPPAEPALPAPPAPPAPPVPHSQAVAHSQPARPSPLPATVVATRPHMPPAPPVPRAPILADAPTMRPTAPEFDSKTTAVAPPSGSVAVKTAGPLGLDVEMRWSGELHKARFYARPMLVTIGANGDFAIPDDAMGGKLIDTLVEPDASHGFTLLVGNPAISGQIIVGPGSIVTVADVKAGRTDFKNNRVPMTAKTQAFLQFGEFTFVLSRGAVPHMARPALWSHENTVFLVCWLLAMGMILGPVVASFQLTDPRSRRVKTYIEELEERTAQIIEVENKIEEKKEEEKADEKEEKKEAPKNEVQLQIPKAEIVKKQDELKKVLDEIPKEERDEKIKELVNKEADKATANVDKALADVEARTKLFAMDDAAAGVNPDGNQPSVVADLGDSPSAGPGARTGPAVGSSDDAKHQTAGLDKKLDTGGKGPDVGANIKEGKQKIEAVVRGGSATADGELSPDIIKKVMADKNGAIKACYQKELQKNPDLSGSVKLAFMIGPDGKVVGVKIENSSIENVQVENCMLDNIKTWRFPQAKNGGNTKVNKTWTFKPN